MAADDDMFAGRVGDELTPDVRDPFAEHVGRVIPDVGVALLPQRLEDVEALGRPHVGGDVDGREAIDLVEIGDDRERHVELIDEWLDGLDGAGLRARDDGVDRLVGQPGADSLGLPVTELVEGRVGDPRLEPFGQRPPVANDNELGHQETPVTASSG